MAFNRKKVFVLFLKDFFKFRFLGLTPRVFDLVNQEQALIMCSSSKFTGDINVDAAGLGPHTKNRYLRLVDHQLGQTLE